MCRWVMVVPRGLVVQRGRVIQSPSLTFAFSASAESMSRETREDRGLAMQLREGKKKTAEQECYRKEEREKERRVR